MPVEILGLLEVPTAGDQFLVFEDEKLAREIAERRTAQRRAESLMTDRSFKLTEFSKEVSEGGIAELRVILKADVSGSLGAIQTALLKLNEDMPEGVRLSITFAGTGAGFAAINAEASNGNANNDGFNSSLPSGSLPLTEHRFP